MAGRKLKHSHVAAATSLFVVALAFSGAIAQSQDRELPSSSQTVLTDASNRMRRGLENLEKIDGEAGHRVIESLKEVSPDLARYTIEYPFADVYARPGLDLRSREIATIAALTAMGNAKPQLKVHIQAGLNVGLTKKEIEEIIIQMSVYAGFPAALNGMQAFKEVISQEPPPSVEKQ